MEEQSKTRWFGNDGRSKLKAQGAAFTSNIKEMGKIGRSGSSEIWGLKVLSRGGSTATDGKVKGVDGIFSRREERRGFGRTGEC